jgi:cytochrome o ubiquinol oxidase operon protein cyoD
MSKDKVVVSHHDAAPGSIKSYTIGFALSLVLTFVTFIIADKQLMSGWAMVYVLAVLAIVQLFVQLIFFLHVGRESSQRWNTATLLFAAMVVIILVFGSLWIMSNLNYMHEHGEEPEMTNEQIIHDEGY